MLIKVKIPKGFLCNAIEEKILVPQEPFSEQFFKKNLSVKNIFPVYENICAMGGIYNRISEMLGHFFFIWIK